MKRPSSLHCRRRRSPCSPSLPMAALADDRCDDPHGSIDAARLRDGRAGPRALRRFVERTRTIYNLYYFDYARGDTSRLRDRARSRERRDTAAAP